MAEKFQWFNGIKFTLDEKTGYYLNSTIRKRIHRYIWEFYNGEIPKGYHVHHIDKDKSNNDISNLALMTAAEHEKMHARENVLADYQTFADRMTHARKFASFWHGSPAGRAWHKKHYEQCKEALHRKALFCCEQCGKSFTAETSRRNRFCSNKCKSAWRRKAGVDNEGRKCECCGRDFTCNKYSKTRFCSRQCANRARKIFESKAS